jgi:hypothetical protein
MANRQDAIRHIYDEHRGEDFWPTLKDWASRGENWRERWSRWRAVQRYCQGQRDNSADEERHMWNHRRKYARRRKRQIWDNAHQPDEPDEPTSGVYVPERSWNPNRRPVCAGFVPIIDRAQDKGWSGILNSGWRDPAYSEQLCYNMCGAPTCPGRCAGRYSRHSQCPWQNGAIDVSDPYTFDRVTPELFNALGAADPWHMSTTGH